MIDCNTYDYVEIACLYHLLVKLTLFDGTELLGKANTTCINDERHECVQLIDDTNNKILVVLEQSKYMLAMQSNQHFKRVDFETNQVEKY